MQGIRDDSSDSYSENGDGDRDDDLNNKLSDKEEESSNEIWSDVSEKLFDQDITSDTPLPDPTPNRRKVVITRSILQWLLYFWLQKHQIVNFMAWVFY